MSDFEKEFYTVTEVAELLKVHEQTIRRMIHAGKLEYYKVGSQMRISASELERLKVPVKTSN